MTATNLSINGFQLVSGEVCRFTIVDGSTRYGVVTRTGSNVVVIRQADGTEKELGQCSITHITQDLTDAELVLWEGGYDPAPTPAADDLIGAGRRALFVLIEVCRNDLDAVEAIIDGTERACAEKGIEASKQVLAMRTALRHVRTAFANTKGLLELSGFDASLVRGSIATDEQTAKKGGYWTPKRAFYHQAQRWALDVLAA